MWISYFWIPNREVDNQHTISSLHQRLSSILCQYHQCHPKEQYRVPQAGGRIRTQPPLPHARPCYCRDALRMTYDAYLPYGELLVDEHTSSDDMPYKFNGKELDQETGLYYYGARYMNPVMSL